MGNQNDPRYRNGVFKPHTPSALERVTATLNDPTCYGWARGPINDLGYPTWLKGDYTLFFFPGWAETPAGWYRDCGNGQVTWYETTVIAQVNSFLFGKFSYGIEQEVIMSTSNTNGTNGNVSGLARPAGMTRQCEEFDRNPLVISLEDISDDTPLLVHCQHPATHRLTLVDEHGSPYVKKVCEIHQVKLHQEIEAGCSLVTILDEQVLEASR